MKKMIGLVGLCLLLQGALVFANTGGSPSQIEEPGASLNFARDLLLDGYNMSPDQAEAVISELSVKGIPIAAIFKIDNSPNQCIPSGWLCFNGPECCSHECSFLNNDKVGGCN
jgi:hypothetical protein